MADTTSIKDAQACLSLSYKYSTLRDCVNDQRPTLAKADPMLVMLNAQIDALEQAFARRVTEIADAEEEPTNG